MAGLQRHQSPRPPTNRRRRPTRYSRRPLETATRPAIARSTDSSGNDRFDEPQPAETPRVAPITARAHPEHPVSVRTGQPHPAANPSSCSLVALPVTQCSDALRPTLQRPLFKVKAAASLCSTIAHVVLFEDSSCAIVEHREAAALTLNRGQFDSRAECITALGDRQRNKRAAPTGVSGGVRLTRSDADRCSGWARAVMGATQCRVCWLSFVKPVVA